MEPDRAVGTMAWYSHDSSANLATDVRTNRRRQNDNDRCTISKEDKIKTKETKASKRLWHTYYKATNPSLIITAS